MKNKIDVKVVKRLLEEQNKTQKELASYLGLNTGLLSEALRGSKRRGISMDYILSIGKFFKVKPHTLVIK